MKRTGLLLCILILLSVSTTGCWSRRELNNLAIAVGLGIDKVGDRYKVTVQIVEPNEIAGKTSSNVSPVTNYQATGDTILEALRKMTTISPRKIYIAHLRILVLSEALAKEGISEAIELLSRDPEARNDFFIIIAREAAADKVLRVLTNLERIPSVRLFSSLESSEKQWAPTTAVKIDDLIADLTSDGNNAVLTGIKIIGDVSIGETTKNVEMVKSSAELQYSGLAVFKKDKLIGWLNEDEGKGYNYIENHVSSTAGSVKCPDGGKISLKVMSSKTKIKGSIRNERPEIDIEVKAKANIAEVQCKIDLSNAEMIAVIEKAANEKLEKLIKKTVARVQKDYKVDIFKFGEAIHRSNPNEWKKLKSNWNQTFKELPINVKVKYKIDHLGKVSNSFLQKME